MDLITASNLEQNTSFLKNTVSCLLKIRQSSCWDVVDVKGDLVLIKLKEDSIHSEIDEFGRLHGVILDVTNGVIPVSSFGFAKSYLYDTGIPTDDSSEDQYFTPCYDGVMVRVFYYKGTVYYSTHNKIQYTNSRWVTTKKFSVMYSDADGPKDHEYFDMSHESSSTCYNVLIVDTEIAVASRQFFQSTTLFLAGAFTNGLDAVPGILNSDRLKPVPKFTSEEAVKYLLGPGGTNSVLDEGEAFNIVYTKNSQVVGFLKFMSNSHEYRKTIRASNPNVLNRLYELFDTPEDSPLLQYDQSVVADVLAIDIPELNLSFKHQREMCVGYLYAWSLPEHYRKSVLKELQKLYETRQNIIRWIINYSQKIPKSPTGAEELIFCDDMSERGYDIIMHSRSSASAYVKSHPEETFFKAFQHSVKITIFNEYGKSLYRLMKKMATPVKAF